MHVLVLCFFFQAEDGIRDGHVTGVQTCALPISPEQLEVQRSTSGQVPAAAADQGRTEARTRVLVLETDTDDGVRASLVVHGGESIIQQSAAAELRDVQPVRSGTAVDEDPG